MELNVHNFAKMIEFSLVRPDATEKNVEKFCGVVRENNFATASDPELLILPGAEHITADRINIYKPTKNKHHYY